MPNTPTTMPVNAGTKEVTPKVPTTTERDSKRMPSTEQNPGQPVNVPGRVDPTNVTKKSEVGASTPDVKQAVSAKHEHKPA